MKKRILKIGIAITIMLILFVIIYFFFFVDEDNAIQDETAVKSAAEVIFPVEVAIAQKGSLVKYLQVSGVLRANKEVEILAQVSGAIIEAKAYKGKYVNAGDTLVRIDDREYRVAYERAKTNLLSAQMEYNTMLTFSQGDSIDATKTKKNYDNLKKQFQKTENDYLQGSISIDDYERAKRDYETKVAYINVNRSDVMANKSGLSSALEGYVRAKINLEETCVKAPFSGYVADCELSAGMRVAPAKLLMKLVDISKLFVDVDILESEIGNIIIGRKVDISVNAFPNNKFIGEVKYINPIVDTKTKTVKVTMVIKDITLYKKVDMQNVKQKLSPGMFATVKIETDIIPNQLIVPKNSLLVRDQRTLVFKKEGILAKWCYVDVADENEEFISIRQGIAAGDTVIISGHYTLAHDAKVRLAK